MIRLQSLVQILLLLKVFYVPTFAIEPPSSTLVINQQRSAGSAFLVHQKNHPSLHKPLFSCRGGGEIMDTTSNDAQNNIIKSSTETITNALVSGPHIQGIAALYFVSAISVTLFTMIRPSYAFSVGYGGSVAVMALALMMAFDVPFTLPSQKMQSLPALLVNASLLYGVRLAVYLAFRRLTVPSIRNSTSKTDQMSKSKGIKLALSVSILYTFMMTPVLYALRRGKIDENIMPNKIQSAGVIIAYVGLFMEAISDMHKYIVKWQNNAEYGSEIFVGPTSGTFRICRHPSFFGEMTFWFGLFLGGTVAFGKSIPAWLCSTLGLFGIFSVMSPSSKGLDQRQLERYGGQEKYDSYRLKVKGSLFPSF